MTGPKLSTAERIAEDVIARINSGHLKPGERIREQELALRFKTSRGPVREALRILQSKFWVILEPGKGARVIHVENTENPDATLIGQALNGVAARFAAGRATAEEQAEIERQAHSIADIAATDISPEAFSEKTWRLGSYVVRAARSSRLDELIGSFSKGGLIVLAHEGVVLRSQRVEAARLWVDLAVAIRLRDGAEAENVMKRLIGRSMKAVLRATVHSGIWRYRDNNEPVSE